MNGTIVTVLLFIFIGPPNNTPVTTRPPSVEMFDNITILNRVDVGNITNVEKLQPKQASNLESVDITSESNIQQSKQYTSNISISTSEGRYF